MRDSIRLSVSSDSEGESVRIHDDAGTVTAGDATFSATITATGSSRCESETRPKSPQEAQQESRYIGSLTDIPSDTTLRCEAIKGQRGTEIIVRREGNDVFAWRNSCPHRPTIPLDPGGGAIVDDDQLVCHEHGARFDCGDGVCTSGPCQGDILDEIDVAVQDGDVLLADEQFDGCRRLE